MSAWDSDPDLEEQGRDKIQNVKEHRRESSDIHVHSKGVSGQESDTLEEYKPDMPPADKIQESYYENPAEPASATRKHSLSLHAANRVSPIGDCSREIPRNNTRSVSKEDMRRKKDTVIGGKYISILLYLHDYKYLFILQNLFIYLF